MATQRKTTAGTGNASISSTTVNGNADYSSIMKSTPSDTLSPFLPTVSETIFLALYPLTLLLGSLYATFHPALRAADYLPDAQSYDPRIAPSYFAKKNNVFNVYFVKIGWVWMTLAFFAHTLSSSGASSPQQQTQLTRRRLQAGLRYLCATTAWFAMTQWFFGPAIIDRSFRWTGGQCEAVFGGERPEDQLRRAEMGDVREVFTHAACKAIGGTWRGGHDISGHVFLLILGSAMLVLEVLPVVVRWIGGKGDDGRRVRMADGSIQDAVRSTTTTADIEGRDQGLGVGVKGALAVAGLSWWMLLMTAAYFHTWFEKLTGSLVAFAAIYIIYFLPRAIPAVRGVLGLPGV